MRGKKKPNRLTGALMALLGAACALILCAVFYGTMVYQLADRTDDAQAKQAETAKTLALGSGEMESESRERVQMGGKLCDVLTRTYLLADGTRAQAITASPAAYIERMKQEGWQAQLVTGFAIGETDAVYARSGENAMLCAKDGETVYMIIATSRPCTRSAWTLKQNDAYKPRRGAPGLVLSGFFRACGLKNGEKRRKREKTEGDQKYSKKLAKNG